MNEVTFEIKQHIGVLASHDSGWTKEINVVSWNQNSPKYYIRDWSPDHKQMGRGITLTNEEISKLVTAVRSWL